MFEWVKNLDPVVQAAIIGACATVLGVIIKGIFDVITNKKKKGNTTTPNIKTTQSHSGNNNVNFGEQNQDGSGNVQNTYINCSIQPVQSSDDNVDERIEKYIQEHTVTKEDIDKMFSDDVITLDGGTAEGHSIEKIGNAVIATMNNLAGGKTVLIGDEKTITEQIIKEHDAEIEKALSEL